MKMITLTAILSMFVLSLSAPPLPAMLPVILLEPVKDQRLLNAIIQVESKGNPNVINWKENALGLLQIRPVMLNEVNRILKEQGKNERYTHRDCLDSTKSIQMYWIVQNYWNPANELKRGAIVWNGKSKRNLYYAKILKQI
jgi:hypothetical protein